VNPTYRMRNNGVEKKRFQPSSWNRYLSSNEP